MYVKVDHLGTVETDNAPSEGKDLRIERWEFKGHGGCDEKTMIGKRFWDQERFRQRAPSGCTEKRRVGSLDPKPGRSPDNVTFTIQ